MTAHRNSNVTNYENEEMGTAVNVKKSKNVRFMKSVKKTKKQLPTPPRDILSFEVSDVYVPTAEFEKLYREAKDLEHYDRVKRSVEQSSSRKMKKENSTYITSTTEHHSFVTLPVPPKIFKFELSDAKIPDSSQISQRTKNISQNGNSTVSYKSNIYKRDSSSHTSNAMYQKTIDSRKIRFISPLSVSGNKKRSAKYQAYEELPFNTQKIIDKAIDDAKSNKKLNNGEYLQFYYGDKIIITPLYPKKHEIHKPSVPTNLKPMNGNQFESYWSPKTKQKFVLAHDNFVLNPKLLGTKQSYFVADNILIPKEPLKPQMIINPALNVDYKEQKPTALEQNSVPNLNHLIGQSSSYEKLDSKLAVGPILFHPELSQPKPEEAFSYVNVEAPRSTTIVRTVDSKYNQLLSYQQYMQKYNSNHMIMPQLQFNHIKKPHLPLPPPTSYQELINFNSANNHEEKEDYEFG